jgi:hypothetical protein
MLVSAPFLVVLVVRVVLDALIPETIVVPSAHLCLCSSFPHGDAVILPIILTTMGVMSTLLTFGLWPLMGQDTTMPNYGCIEYNLAGSRDHECFPLLLNDEKYWSDSMAKDADQWAATIQTGSVFGILSCVMGVIAWGLLISSTCLEIKKLRLLVIRVLLLGSSILALLTLTALAADVCDFIKQGNVTGSCDVKRIRLDYGGLAMIAGFILHLIALLTTMGIGGPIMMVGGGGGGARQPVIEKQESAPMDSMENTA